MAQSSVPSRATWGIHIRPTAHDLDAQSWPNADEPCLAWCWMRPFASDDWPRGTGAGPSANPSAARQFGEELPDRDRRIQVLTCERHGVPAVLHRIQDDHGVAVLHPGHAVDRATPTFTRQR